MRVLRDFDVGQKDGCMHGIRQTGAMFDLVSEWATRVFPDLREAEAFLITTSGMNRKIGFSSVAT
jgi:hypothetical protein